MRTYLKQLIVGTAMLAATSAAATDVTNLTDAERDAFRSEVRSYLLDNPEIIYEAIQLLEARREADVQQADVRLIADNAEAIFNDGYSFVGGNPDGDVTVVEFLDYRCGYCKKAHPEVMKLVESDPNIRLVVKEFPILGPASTKVAKMAMAALAMDPERYGVLNDRLMTHRGAMTESTAYQIASGLGFDIADLKVRAREQDIEQKIQTTYRLANALQINGTPAFVIGNQMIRGYVPLDQMQASVERARATR